MDNNMDNDYGSNGSNSKDENNVNQLKNGADTKSPSDQKESLENQSTRQDDIKRDLHDNKSKEDISANKPVNKTESIIPNLSITREILDWALHIGAAIVIALLIVKFIAQVTVVIGSSMYPTLQDGNRLVMEKLTNRFGTFERGDIVVVEAKKELESRGLPVDHSPLIKRIIGIPGDTIQVKDGKVFVNDNLKEETYINGNYTENGLFLDPKASITVPEGFLFVMGDNRKRNMSVDSRELGLFERSRIVGRVFVRLYPLSEFGGLNK